MLFLFESTSTIVEFSIATVMEYFKVIVVEEKILFIDENLYD